MSGSGKTVAVMSAFSPITTALELKADIAAVEANVRF
jgi:hypothetical protein